MTEPADFHILAICSGNVCRSPLVELILQLELRVRADFAVSSAGTTALPGQHMTAEMVDAAVGLGIARDVAAAHQSARLDERKVENADLILALTREHRAAAVALHPAAVKRAFTLTEFARLVKGLGTSSRPALTPRALIAEASSLRGPLARTHNGNDDIADPIGQSREVYERVSEEIAAAIGAIAPALLSTRPGTGQQRSSARRKAPFLAFSFPPA